MWLCLFTLLHFETARDTIRHKIQSQNTIQFPYARGTSVAALSSAILAPQNFVAISSPESTNCEYSEPSIDNSLKFIIVAQVPVPDLLQQMIIAQYLLFLSVQNIIRSHCHYH